MTDGFNEVKPATIHYNQNNKCLCTKNIIVKKKKISKDWELVTCKNCLRFRNILK